MTNTQPLFQEALDVLQELWEAGDLEDHYYHIRESEGLGWEGPRMLRWGEACQRMREILRLHKQS